MIIIAVKMENIILCDHCGSVKTEVREYERVRYRCRQCQAREQRKARHKHQEEPDTAGCRDVFWACDRWLKDRGIDSDEVKLNW